MVHWRKRAVEERRGQKDSFCDPAQKKGRRYGR